MGGAHVTGGGFGALLGVTAVTLLNRYAGTHLGNAEASVIGGGTLALGVGLGHVVATEGLFPAIKRALFGPVSKPLGTAQAAQSASSYPTAPAPAGQDSVPA